MDERAERAVLMTQAQVLLQELEWAERTLEALSAVPTLQAAVKNSLGVRFNRLRKDLETMQGMLPQSSSLNTYWSSLQRHSAECRALLVECLSFMGGLLLRSNQLDGEICAIADALLHELMARTPQLYPGSTVLAEGDFFTETTGIIRLRFPMYSVWNLPVAAHELGHYAVRRINDDAGDFPFQKKFREVEDDATQTAHLHELLADLFAVYILGPAYPCACILWRFSPKDETAQADGERHPSHAKRIHFMLQTLGAMNKAGMHPYTGLIKTLTELWQRSWQSAKQSVELDAPEAARLNILQSKLYDLFEKNFSTARFARWAQANTLSRQMATNETAEQLLGKGITLTDVVNAAWLWRMRQEDADSRQLRQVSDKALTMCRLLAARPRN
jgi:hypothetical protein